MTKIVVGNCPSCGPGIRADIVEEYRASWANDDAAISGSDNHRILQCRGCELVYFQTESYCSEDDGPKCVYWPPPEKRKKPHWLLKLIQADEQLTSLLDEAYTALNSNILVLAAIGLRTVFDRSSEVLGIDPDIGFAKKLDALLKQGKIGTEEREILDVLTDAGNAAAHRGWRPSEQEIETMFEIVEGFIHRSFHVKPAATQLRATVPTRNRKVGVTSLPKKSP